MGIGLGLTACASTAELPTPIDEASDLRPPWDSTLLIPLDGGPNPEPVADVVGALLPMDAVTAVSEDATAVDPIETLDLESNDTVLELYATEGQARIAVDDDGGDGLASRISWAAPADGRYLIMVRNFSNVYGGPQAYSLRITIRP